MGTVGIPHRPEAAGVGMACNSVRRMELHYSHVGITCNFTVGHHRRLLGAWECGATDRDLICCTWESHFPRGNPVGGRGNPTSARWESRLPTVGMKIPIAFPPCIPVGMMQLPGSLSIARGNPTVGVGIPFSLSGNVVGQTHFRFRQMQLHRDAHATDKALICCTWECGGTDTFPSTARWECSGTDTLAPPRRSHPKVL